MDLQLYDFATRRRLAESPARCEAEAWAAMAGFGWLAPSLPEAHGGLGGDAGDVGILMEGPGRGLVLEPIAGGADALVPEPHRPLHDLDAPAAGLPPELLPVVPTCLNSRAHTIFGGTSGVQRDIIAKTMPGL